MDYGQGQIFLLTLRISTLFIMILQGRRGPKSAEQQRAKTPSEIKYLALIMENKTLAGWNNMRMETVVSMPYRCNNYSYECLLACSFQPSTGFFNLAWSYNE